MKRLAKMNKLLRLRVLVKMKSIHDAIGKLKITCDICITLCFSRFNTIFHLTVVAVKFSLCTRIPCAHNTEIIKKIEQSQDQDHAMCKYAHVHRHINTHTQDNRNIGNMKEH